MIFCFQRVFLLVSPPTKSSRALKKTKVRKTSRITVYTDHEHEAPWTNRERFRSVTVTIEFVYGNHEKRVWESTRKAPRNAMETQNTSRRRVRLPQLSSGLRGSHVNLKKERKRKKIVLKHRQTLCNPRKSNVGCYAIIWVSIC